MTDSTVKRPRTIVAAHDQGNLHNRMVYDTGGERRRSKFESYLYELPTDSGELSTNDGWTIASDGSSAGIWTNKRFVVGSEALSYHRMNGVRVMDAIANKYRLALPMVVAHIWKEIAPNSTVIKLAVSNPDVERNGQRIIDHLQGQHTVKALDGGKMTDKTFSIEIIKVYTEGQGVIKAARGSKNKPTNNTVMFDIGNDTFIFSQFDGYEQKDPLTLDACGVRDFIGNLMTDSELKGVTDYTFEDLIDMFEIAKRKRGEYRYLLNAIDVTAIVHDRAERWITHAINQAGRYRPKAMEYSGSKIATGGACLIAPIRDALIAGGFTIAPDVIWSNAEGCYEFACKKVGRSVAEYPSKTVKPTASQETV